MPVSKTLPLTVGLVGCGAVAEQYYAPALKTLERDRTLQVAALFDPDPKRSAQLQTHFPQARALRDWAAVLGSALDLGIVASPAQYHAQQSVELLQNKVAVLCEKPMATSVADARRMARVSAETGTLLAVGLFRRFFPALQMICQIVRHQLLGKIVKIDIQEGSRFQWPAQSASFFHKAQSGGGVLLDLGVHALDLVLWWLGEPAAILYEDDAMGGLEANCCLHLEYPGISAVQIRLSRDTQLLNRYDIHCEKGAVSWRVGKAAQLDLSFQGSALSMHAALFQTAPFAEGAQAAADYNESFLNQLRNVLAAMRGQEDLTVPGESALLTQQWIESCYRQRRLLEMPWLSTTEYARARELNALSNSC